MRARRFLAASVLSIFGLALLGSAPLHLKLDRSVPAADTVLSEAPKEIRLDFSQPPELAVSRVTLSGPRGAVELGELKRAEDDDTILLSAVAGDMSDGTYTVEWRTASADGHPLRGAFSFNLAAGGASGSAR